MQSKLTAKQQHFLAYLEREIKAGWQAPSLRQAALDMGVSHAAVAQIIKALEEKGYVKRDGRYSRTIHILNRAREVSALHRWREIPIVGRITAGLPMYAQTEWEGSIVVDASVYRGQNLFVLRVKGDSMKDAGILNADLAVCEPRQYAQNGEIVAVLINLEEATIKRFFLCGDHIELRPENADYPPMHYGLGEVLIQGKLVGILRAAEGID